MGFGVLAVGLTAVAGFVIPSLQNPFVLVVLFALVVTALMLGRSRMTDWLQLHARLVVVVVAFVVVGVLPLAVLYLVQPTYIGPTGIR